MKNKIILILTIFFLGIVSVYAKEEVQLSACVDGDTIKIVQNQEVYTIRMLAVDTPESVHPTIGVEYYGKEASEYTCNLVTNAKKIEIEYDSNSDKTDKYNRLLVWVFIDGELLQKQLVEKGYAKVAYLYNDYKYTKELQQVQEKASAQNIGIWNEQELQKYNSIHGINEDAKDKEDEQEYQTTTEELKDEVNSLITTIKKFKPIDYILIIILVLILVFSSNKKVKNKVKKMLKKQLK